MRNYINYWSTDCIVYSLEEGYHSALPTVECECSTPEEAEIMADSMQDLEDEAYHKEVSSC